MQRYFLLLLARALQRVVESNGRYPELDAFSLPRFDVHQLSNVESSTDDLSKLIPSIKNDTEMLQALGFPENKTAEIFDRKLPALLNGLKEKTRVGIKEILRATPISQEKVGEFREQARSGFEREAIFRRILQFYGLVQDKTAEPLGPNTPETWGIVQVDDKAAFFADWYSSYSGLGEGYGQGLAQSENNFIIKSLFDRASSNLGTLDQVLGSFTDPAQALIFAGHMTVFHNFEQGNNNFTSKWMKGADPIELDGFEGWYQWYGHKIPVFVCHLDEGKVIIVDRLNVGTLIQYDPTRQGDRPADRTGILSVSVRALSHEPDLLNEFLEKPPTWLQEIGDKNAQEAHLKEKVLIRVLERFEFRIVAEPAITLIDSLVPEE